MLQRFTARVYNAGGRLVGSFRGDERFSMAAQPRGVYVVSWQCGTQRRSVKFRK